MLLDDSKVDKSNPLKEAKKKTIYRLWTAQVSQEFEIKKKSQNVDDWEVKVEKVNLEIEQVKSVLKNTEEK